MHVQHAENKQIHEIKVIRYLQFWGDFLTFQCSLFSKQDYPAFKRAVMVWMAQGWARMWRKITGSSTSRPQRRYEKTYGKQEAR